MGRVSMVAEQHGERTMLAMVAAQAERAILARGRTDTGGLCEEARSPAARVPLERGLEAWRRLPDVTGRDTAGLSVGSATSVTTFHQLGVAFASAPHLLGAVQVFTRYFPYLCQADHLFEYSLHGETVVGWDESADVAPATLRDYIFVELVRALRDYPWFPVRPRRVELSDAEAQDADEYRDAFGCAVHLGATRSRIVLDTATLAVPLRGSNPELHYQVALRLAAKEAGTRSAARRVCGAIEHLLDRHEPRIEAVARHLGLSVRTLQSRLAGEGYRYSHLLRLVRQRRALYLLCETVASTRSIAFSLGYADTGSFQRAFREWFGIRPVDFRTRHCGQ